MPKSIRYFQWCWFGAILLSLITVVTGSVIGRLAADGVSESMLWLIYIILLGIPIFLVLLVSISRSKVAKWFLVIWYAYEVLTGIAQVAAGSLHSSGSIPGFMSFVASSAGMYFLFTKESRDWLNGKEIVPTRTEEP